MLVDVGRFCGLTQKQKLHKVPLGVSQYARGEDDGTCMVPAYLFEKPSSKDSAVAYHSTIYFSCFAWFNRMAAGILHAWPAWIHLTYCETACTRSWKKNPTGWGLPGPPKRRSFDPSFPEPRPRRSLTGFFTGSTSSIRFQDVWR